MHYLPRLGLLRYTALIFSALVGCDAALSPAEKREKAVAAVGAEASVAAAIFVSATRSCRVVGANSIEECAKIKSSLLAEQSAQITAEIAEDMIASYWKNCEAEFSRDYCNQLIQRAVAIEYRKPREPQ